MSRDPQSGDNVEDFDAWAAEQDWAGDVPLCDATPEQIYSLPHGNLAVPASRKVWLTPGKIFVSDDGRLQPVRDAGWYKPSPWWVEDERADKHRVCCSCSPTPVAVERMRRPRRGTQNRERREALD